MKRSSSQAELKNEKAEKPIKNYVETIECKFIKINGEAYDVTFKIPRNTEVSEVLRLFCEATDNCVYQTKLVFKDSFTDYRWWENGKLDDQFEITDNNITFNVIKEQNEFIPEWYWVSKPIKKNGDGKRVQEVILPKAKTIHVYEDYTKSGQRPRDDEFVPPDWTDINKIVCYTNVQKLAYVSCLELSVCCTDQIHFGEIMRGPFFEKKFEDRSYQLFVRIIEF